MADKTGKSNSGGAGSSSGASSASAAVAGAGVALSPAVFPNYSEWRRFYDMRVGSDAPHYATAAAVRGNPGAVRAFYSRVLTSYFHPESSHYHVFLATLRRTSAQRDVMLCPDTYKRLLNALSTHQQVVQAAGCEPHVANFNRLAGIAATGDAQHQLRPYDLRAPEDVQYALRRFADDPAKSPLLAEARAADRRAADIRAQLLQMPGSTSWMHHPSITMRLRAIRSMNATAGGAEPAADAPMASLPAESVAVPAGVVVPPELTPEQEEAAARYIAAQIEARSARKVYEERDPGHLAAEAFRTAFAHAQHEFHVAKYMAEMKTAESARGRKGNREGGRMEDLVWGQCHAHVAAAMRVIDRDLGEAVSRTSTAFVDAAEPGALEGGSRLLLLRNVEYYQAQKLIGELDGVLVDAMKGCAVAVLEVKATPGDLCYARSQRDRFFLALQRASAADPPPEAVMRFRVKGPHANIVGKTAALPAVDIGFFTPTLTNSKARWLFVTRDTQDHPEVAPICSKIAHVFTSELAAALAMSGWRVPASPVATDASAAVASLSDAALIDVTRAVHGRWAKSCGANDDDDLQMGAVKLREEAWYLRCRMDESAASGSPVAAADGPSVVPLVIWCRGLELS